MTARYPDGVSRYAASPDDLERFRSAEVALGGLRTPALDSRNGDAITFLAFFDGTGNDADDPTKGDTNVERLYRQAQAAADNDNAIGAYYVRGPGTQENAAVAALDGARGASYDARLETMYYEYCKWATKRLREDPTADVSVVSVGFSRGAEQAAGFTRMVAERGIENPDTADITRNGEGLIVSARYPGEPIRSGREIAQAAVLFDPVGTGEPRDRDRRLPPEVLSALQITALHERRDLFEGTRILDPGLTHAGRFLNVAVPGCHSDVGGSYGEDGLSRRSLNIATDYLNALVKPPIFEKVHLRPDLDVIHRSVEHAPFYDDDVYRRRERRGLPEDALRSHREVLDGTRRGSHGAASRDAEPIDHELDARYERRNVEIGPVPPTPEPFRGRQPAHQREDLQPRAPARPWLQRGLGLLAEAETADDRSASRDVLAAYLDTPQGRAFAAQVEAGAMRMREAEQLARDEAMARHVEQHAPRVRALAI